MTLTARPRLHSDGAASAIAFAVAGLSIGLHARAVTVALLLAGLTLAIMEAGS
jgi:hypothetical protein